MESMKVEHISTLIKGQADFQRITSSSTISLVNFFAPWCHWCQALAPTYEGVAQRVKNGPLQSIATVAKVDCTEPRNYDVCRMNNIQAYPTIIAYVPRGTNKFIHYHGARTVDALMHFIEGLNPSGSPLPGILACIAFTQIHYL